MVLVELLENPGMKIKPTYELDHLRKSATGSNTKYIIYSNCKYTIYSIVYIPRYIYHVNIPYDIIPYYTILYRTII